MGEGAKVVVNIQKWHLSTKIRVSQRVLSAIVGFPLQNHLLIYILLYMPLDQSVYQSTGSQTATIEANCHKTLTNAFTSSEINQLQLCFDSDARRTGFDALVTR